MLIKLFVLITAVVISSIANHSFVQQFLEDPSVMSALCCSEGINLKVETKRDCMRAVANLSIKGKLISGINISGNHYCRNKFLECCFKVKEEDGFPETTVDEDYSTDPEDDLLDDAIRTTEPEGQNLSSSKPEPTLETPVLAVSESDGRDRAMFAETDNVSSSTFNVSEPSFIFEKKWNMAIDQSTPTDPSAEKLVDFGSTLGADVFVSTSATISQVLDDNMETVTNSTLASTLETSGLTEESTTELPIDTEPLGTNLEYTTPIHATTPGTEDGFHVDSQGSSLDDNTNPEEETTSSELAPSTLGDGNNVTVSSTMIPSATIIVSESTSRAGFSASTLATTSQSPDENTEAVTNSAMASTSESSSVMEETTTELPIGTEQFRTNLEHTTAIYETADTEDEFDVDFQGSGLHDSTTPQEETISTELTPSSPTGGNNVTVPGIIIPSTTMFHFPKKFEKFCDESKYFIEKRHRTSVYCYGRNFNYETRGGHLESPHSKSFLSLTINANKSVPLELYSIEGLKPAFHTTYIFGKTVHKIEVDQNDLLGIDDLPMDDFGHAELKKDGRPVLYMRRVVSGPQKNMSKPSSSKADVAKGSSKAVKDGADSAQNGEGKKSAKGPKLTFEQRAIKFYKQINDAVAQFSDSITCSKCGDLFTEAQRVKCGHYFCLDCVTGMLKVKGKRSATCPVKDCQEEFFRSSYKPAEALDDLLKVYTLMDKALDDFEDGLDPKIKGDQDGDSDADDEEEDEEDEDDGENGSGDDESKPADGGENVDSDESTEPEDEDEQENGDKTQLNGDYVNSSDPEDGRESLFEHTHSMTLMAPKFDDSILSPLVASASDNEKLRMIKAKVKKLKCIGAISCVLDEVQNNSNYEGNLDLDGIGNVFIYMTLTNGQSPTLNAGQGATFKGPSPGLESPFYCGGKLLAGEVTTPPSGNRTGFTKQLREYSN
ncbi:hypothetical protein HDE_09541 [Halotydeus destructor]|nr:hypothetical protein HDE_09541 [Halotydeus destructor]